MEVEERMRLMSIVLREERERINVEIEKLNRELRMCTGWKE